MGEIVAEGPELEEMGIRFKCNLHRVSTPSGKKIIKMYCHKIRKPAAAEGEVPIPPKVIKDATALAVEAARDFAGKAAKIIGKEMTISPDPSTAIRQIYDRFKFIGLEYGVKVGPGEVMKIDPFDGVLIEVDTGGYSFFFRIGIFQTTKGTIPRVKLVMVRPRLISVFRGRKLIYTGKGK